MRGVARQRTLQREAVLEGVGLHSGKTTRITLKPHYEGHGIVFSFPYEKDYYPVTPLHGEGSYLCSNLSFGKYHVRTVEHLLSSLCGLAINQVEIFIEGEEIPILDGSAKPIVQAILDAGIQELNANQTFIRLTAPIIVYHQESFAAIYPSGELRITYAVDYQHPWASSQIFDSIITPEIYKQRIAGARTFGFRKDVETLRSKGLIKGGSLENAILIDDDGYSSPLRQPDELICHKVLDLIGDLGFLNQPLLGHVMVFKGGHSLHYKLVRGIYDYVRSGS